MTKVENLGVVLVIGHIIKDIFGVDDRGIRPQSYLPTAGGPSVRENVAKEIAVNYRRIRCRIFTYFLKQIGVIIAVPRTIPVL